MEDVEKHNYDGGVLISWDSGIYDPQTSSKIKDVLFYKNIIKPKRFISIFIIFIFIFTFTLEVLDTRKLLCYLWQLLYFVKRLFIDLHYFLIFNLEIFIYVF